MDELLRQRILAINPWFLAPGAYEEEVQARLPHPLVSRRVDLAEAADPGNARLIVGPRQAGKSTIVWKHLAARPPESILFLDAEDLLVRQWCRSAAGFLADLRQELPTVRTVFLDEAQRLEEAGLFVKGLVDAGRNLEIYVTGSSSFHLEARTRESLAGRAERYLLLPFSLAEVAGHEPPALPIARRQRAVADAQRMLVWGGYPRAWLGQDPRRVLSNLVEAFVLRDASDRFAIERPDALRKLLQLAAGQVGQLVNFSEWASLAGIAASTVRSYVNILEESWILKLLPAFAGGRRLELTSSPRIHFYDPGIRNAILQTFSEDVEHRPDRGSLFEGLVFAELARTVPRHWLLQYWRSKGGAEVDFVLTLGERRIGVEVKAGGRPLLSRSASSFIDAYAPTEFLMVTGLADPGLPVQVLGNTSIHAVGLVNLWERLLEVTAPGR